MKYNKKVAADIVDLSSSAGASVNDGIFLRFVCISGPSFILSVIRNLQYGWQKIQPLMICYGQLIL